MSGDEAGTCNKYQTFNRLIFPGHVSMALARILEPLSRKLPVDFRCTAIFSFRPRAGVRLPRFCLFDVCVFSFSFFLFFFYDESVDKRWMMFRAFRFRERW